ncbi:MAG: radical SAM family heme chaperone HemW [Candidatus Lindowbacteria bacterium]|nr:radical SAM family heme chaperone HemW [Candidatus Lindowbacteria bacterium]
MNPVHLYVHIPYCAIKCPYCDFVCDLPKKLPGAKEYADALIRDLEFCQGPLETVFFGGGTPTEMDTAELKRVLEVVGKKIQPGTEWSVEANPKTLTQEIADLLYEFGVTRISLGIQSTLDKVLKQLGRGHQHKDTIEAVQIIKKAGFTNFSGDILFGLPEQDVQQTVDFMIEHNFPHVSAYELTIEGDSHWAIKQKDPSAEGHLKLEQHNIIIDALTSGPYERYEVSNFSQPGFQCRHNLNTWKCGEFAGVGVAAHGHLHLKRYRNTPNAADYVSGTELIDEPITNILADTLLVVMRLVNGVSICDLPNNRQKVIQSPESQVLLHRLQEANYLTFDDSAITPTKKGLLFLNDAVLMVL